MRIKTVGLARRPFQAAVRTDANPAAEAKGPGTIQAARALAVDG